MAGKNRYAYRSGISEVKIRQIVRLFAPDLDASQIAAATGLNRNAINCYVAAFREGIARYWEAESPVSGEAEVAESRAPRDNSQPCGVSESVIHPDGRRGYDGLVDSGCRKRFRVEHGDNEFAGRRSRVNGLESPWAFAKTRPTRFRGLHRHMFYFPLEGMRISV